MIGEAPICVDCKHYNRDPERTQLNCAAFPDGIPERILDSIADHHRPYHGDHGIQFEPVETESE